MIKKPKGKVTKKMKTGGYTKSLRKAQDGDAGTTTAAPVSAPATRTFADAYKANIDAGLRPGQARRIAKGELGLKGPKVDPNAVINAVGNIGGAAINTFGNRGGGSSAPMDFQRKGGSTKYKTGGMVNANKKVSATKSATGKTGGISKAIAKAAVKTASPKGRVGGMSKPPKTALPKAQLGRIIKTVGKIAKAPGGKTVVGGALASGIAGLNRLGVSGNAKVAGKGIASKVASKANKQKMGGSMKGKSC